MITYLNLGTTFQTTVNSESGEIAPVAPCHNAHKTFRNSSTNDLRTNNVNKFNLEILDANTFHPKYISILKKYL